MAVDMIARAMAMDAATGGGVSPDDAYTKAQTDVLLSGKVDKEAGKALSSNDYTDAEKTKLSGIAEGAEVNVNADWEAESGDAQILHKPTLGAAAAKGVDASPTASSTNLVESGGVAEALADKIGMTEVYGNENIVDIPSGEDLDDDTTPGIYGCSTAAIAATLSNCPTTYGFKMEIRTTSASNRFTQLIYENVGTGDMYVRTYAGSGWGVWNRIETDNSVFGRGTLIPADTDLDNLKTIGCYYSNDKTRTQSLVNAPFTSVGFNLEVHKSYQSQSGTDGINQIAYSFASNAFTVYARTYRYISSPAGWSWTAWQVLTFSAT